MAAAAIVLGAIQAGIGISKLIKESRKKAPIDNTPDPASNDTATKYENIYKDLANKAATGELAASNKFITSNRINTVGTANQVFKDPILRFRASTLASTKANEASIQAGLESEKTRFAYLNKASEMGLSQRQFNRQIWNDLMLKRAEQQKLYNMRQGAWGSTVGAGIHNIVGGLDKDKDEDDEEKSEEQKVIDANIGVNTQDNFSGIDNFENV